MNEILSRIFSDQVSLWALNVIVHTTALAAVSLLLARSLRQAAAIRYWVLCFGLMLVLASPGISALMQATGSSWLTIENKPAEVVELVPTDLNTKRLLVDDVDTDRDRSIGTMVAQPLVQLNDPPLSDAVTATPIAVPPATVPT
jgi:hypothetical protein